MDVNSDLVKQNRLSRGWTQQQLSEIANISLRTIQRIEKNGVASNESVSSLAASFEIERQVLLIVPRVDSSQLRKVNFKTLYWSMTIAAVAGAIVSALTVVTLMD